MKGITVEISVTQDEIERLTALELADLIELRLIKEIERYKSSKNKRVLHTAIGDIVYSKYSNMK